MTDYQVAESANHRASRLAFGKGRESYLPNHTELEAAEQSRHRTSETD
jgi:hypothetical protein